VVRLAHLPTDASIAERAAVLKNILETDFRGQMVNIVGHSIGGLDARYLVSVLKTTQVSSITTVGTPHLGTPLADWAWRQADGKGGVWYWLFRLFGYDLKHRRFLQEITTSKMQVFNEKVPDSFDVRYFSVATRSGYKEGRMSYFLWLTSGWLERQKHHLSANGHDGMVPYDSQFWGKNIGTFPLDHLGQLNHHELTMASSRKESMQMWYRIYDNLSKEGL
jgi:triacylglycerol lipase